MQINSRARPSPPSRPTRPRQTLRRRARIDRCLDSELFKALSDPTRLTLLACLAKCGRPCSVSELAECCSVDLSVVSRHLSLLARAGIVRAEKVGRTVFYRTRYRQLSARLRSLADAVEECCPPEGGLTPDGGGCGGTC